MDRPRFDRSPAALVSLFDTTLGRHPEVERRKMFGYPAAFVGGNMAMSLHSDTWVVRLPDHARAELLAVSGARAFEPMPGRPMREYVVLPASILEDEQALDGWVARALAYTASLAPKATASKKPPAKRA